MRMNGLYLLIIGISLHAALVAAFNTDIESFGVVKSPVEDSYFGYSVEARELNGKFKIYTGSPKYGSSKNTSTDYESVSNNATATEGAIYNCDVLSVTEDSKFKLTQSCEKLKLSTAAIEATINGSGTTKNDSETKLPKVASSCNFANDRCGYSSTYSEHWLYKDEYLKSLKGKQKYNYLEKKFGKTKFRRSKVCFPDIQPRTKLSGPPAYTMHGGSITFSPDELMIGKPKRYRLRSLLYSTDIQSFAGKTQCLRFCFNAYSVIDYNVEDPNRNMQYLTGKKRASPRPERTLRVYKKYQNSPKEQIYEYIGGRDKASQFWNYTETNIDHSENSQYKLIFELEIVNNMKSWKCSPASDISLSDIEVTNLPCNEEPESSDEMEGEQSIGMSLDVGTNEEGQSTLTACGSLWQQNCGFAKESSGVCYQFTGNSTTPKIIRNPELKGCIRGKIDIVILVDQSGSVNQCNFQKIKTWLRNIIRGFEIGPNQQDISVVLYSSEESTNDVISLGFQSYGMSGDEKKMRMLQILRELSYEAGTTFTGVAFKHANDMLWGNTSRPDAKKMVILLTDGATSKEDIENLKNQVRLTKQRNATILSVGVAGYDEKELKQISGAENFFGVKEFSELEKVKDTLRQTVSHSNLEGSTGSKSMQNCQMGFSLTSDKKSLLMGAPGCFDRVGDVFSYGNLESRNISRIQGSVIPTKETTILREITLPQTQAKPGISAQKTISAPSLEDVKKVLNKNLGDSYLGYAVALGTFYGSAAGPYSAASAPRYDRKGCVIIYKSTSSEPINDMHILYGHQLGEYFGASLCAEDVNDDGYTDLFVGAPLHIDVESDEGRVYVYMGGTKMRDIPDRILKGSGSPFSRFGLVITSVGDVTADGHNDIVVSAPNEDNNVGAVYVFPGSDNGIYPQFSQKVSGSSLSDVLDLFGQSVSGNIDFDNNGYYDILVGAPKSDKIIFLRSKPVIKIKSRFFFQITEIDRRNENCWSATNTSLSTSPMDIPCLMCTVCFLYEGKTMPSHIRLKYTIKSDTLKKKTRMNFHENTASYTFLEREITLHGTGNEFCNNHSLYLEKNIDDMLTKVEMIMNFDMIDEENSAQEGSSSGVSTENGLNPVLDIFTVKNKTATASFMIDCGDNLTCSADISVLESKFLSQKGDFESSYDMADTYIMRFLLEVDNAGPEEAHSVFIALHYPSFILYSTSTSNCLDISDGEKGYIPASLKRTFLRSDERCTGEFKFLLTSTVERNRLPSIQFYVNSSTISLNDSVENNEKHINISLKYSSSFLIKGYADQSNIYKPTETPTNVSINSTAQSTTTFVHQYSIINNGKIQLRNITLYMLWPTCVSQNDTFGPVNLIKAAIKVGAAYYNFTGIDALRNSSFETCLSRDSTSAGDANECVSKSVSHCSILKAFIPEVLQFRQISINMTGELDWDYFQDQKDIFHLVSKVSIEKNGNVGQFPSGQIYEFEVLTSVHPPSIIDEREEVEDSFPAWWIYALSAAIGLLILLLAIFAMKKLGFFESKYADKRKEAEDDPYFIELCQPMKVNT